MLYGMLFAAFALCTNGAESISGSGPAPPRVIVFSLADDYGYNNVGFAHGPLNKGNPEMRTPTLDRLAGDGVILERHYVSEYVRTTKLQGDPAHLPSLGFAACTQNTAYALVQRV